MPDIVEIDETTELRARVERLENELKAIRRTFYHTIGFGAFVVFAIVNPLILVHYGLGAAWLVLVLTAITIIAGYRFDRTIKQSDD